ncbi:hypothetical protein C8R46DRAFT_1044834 [Mycena filopes]|nr:hypothetical protein C8R46DRAFT_1044834 [Mycena filopes]
MVTRWLLNSLNTSSLGGTLSQAPLTRINDPRLTNLAVDEQLATLSSFAARFLPSLVAGYKSVPEAYSMIMVPVTATAYFGKFMRNPSGSDLYLFHTKRMILLNPSINPSHVFLPPDSMHAILIGISVLASDLLIDGLPKITLLTEETRLRLLDWLDRTSKNPTPQIQPGDGKLDNLEVEYYHKCSFFVSTRAELFLLASSNT